MAVIRSDLEKMKEDPKVVFRPGLDRAPRLCQLALSTRQYSKADFIAYDLDNCLGTHGLPALEVTLWFALPDTPLIGLEKLRGQFYVKGFEALGPWYDDSCSHVQKNL